MWVHLLCMKKGVSLVDEKITKKMTIEMTKKNRNDLWYKLGRGQKLCRLMKKEKAISNC